MDSRASRAWEHGQQAFARSMVWQATPYRVWCAWINGRFGMAVGARDKPRLGSRQRSVGAAGRHLNNQRRTLLRWRFWTYGGLPDGQQQLRGSAGNIADRTRITHVCSKLAPWQTASAFIWTWPCAATENARQRASRRQPPASGTRGQTSGQVWDSGSISGRISSPQPWFGRRRFPAGQRGRDSWRTGDSARRLANGFRRSVKWRIGLPGPSLVAPPAVAKARDCR